MVHNSRNGIELFLSCVSQIRYNLVMNKVHLSIGANPLFYSYLERLGYQIVTVLESPYLNSGIASHPDLFMCKMGSHPKSSIFFGDPKTPKDPYPRDILYNAVCTGKYFIHNLSASDKALLLRAKEMNMILIDVRQGYTKCNTVVVDENSLITSDKGIFNTLVGHSDIDCLLVQQGHVDLPGYSTGFIGGASGRVGDRILFHGNLKCHPDYYQIKQFIEGKGLETVSFDEFPLTDIGSIIETSGWSE
jgi:hypothetical protein